MNTDFTIKNFRVFDKKGTTVDIRPITILTGCNNSGKSSIVKSLCIIKNFCKQIESDYEDGRKIRLRNHKINFHKRPINVMGTFKNVLHKGAGIEKENSDDIEFELVVDSSILMQYVLVTLVFYAKEDDYLDNGYLKSYSIKTLDGNLIYQADLKKGGYKTNFEIVKKQLLYFYYTQRAIAEWQNEYILYVKIWGSDVPENNVKGLHADETIKKIQKKLGNKAVLKVLEWQFSHCRYSWKEGSGGSAQAILDAKEIDDSFINSAELEVFTFFPFMVKVSNLNKADVINKILDKIKKTELSLVDRKLVTVFLKSFEESKEETIHEFVSSWENNIYFNHVSSFSVWPDVWQMDCGIDSSWFIKESDIPETANWYVLLSALDVINRIFEETEKKYVIADGYDDAYSYVLQNHVDTLLTKAVEDVLLHIFPGNIFYTGTSIVDLKRMYSLEEDSEFVDTLKMYLEVRRLVTITTGDYGFIKSQYVPNTFINRWLSEFGIGHHVEIETCADGLGLLVRIYSSEDDKKGMLLVDKGYGVVQLFSILLKIENAIMKNEYLKLHYAYNTDGYGGKIIDILHPYSQLNPATIALEEPENHLHPSFQSKLADMVVEAYKEYNIHFIIESHSEYLIRKLQLLVSKKIIPNEEISLLYVNGEDKPNYKSKIDSIGIDESGNLKNEFGTGFFDESLNLSRDLFNSIKSDEDEG